MNLMEDIKCRVKSNKKTIVLPETMDRRVLEAADMILKEDISNILQCAGLLHDIGNPPFGHFGETTIRDWFKNNLCKLQYKGKNIFFDYKTLP